MRHKISNIYLFWLWFFGKTECDRKINVQRTDKILQESMDGCNGCNDITEIKKSIENWY